MWFPERCGDFTNCFVCYIVNFNNNSLNSFNISLLTFNWAKYASLYKLAFLVLNLEFYGSLVIHFPQDLLCILGTWLCGVAVRTSDLRYSVPCSAMFFFLFSQPQESRWTTHIAVQDKAVCNERWPDEATVQHCPAKYDVHLSMVVSLQVLDIT